MAVTIHAGGPAPTSGLEFFKLGFGGEVVIYPGTYDIAYGRVTAPVLRRALPHAGRLTPLAHRLSGRR